ncbi:dihydroorotate dehydrogenase electron transfer subunit [Chloroflexota bacterium]
MKQVTAKVIKNEQILKELERRRDIDRTRRQDISGSWIIQLNCPEIAREANPGQFVMVRCGEEFTLPRPFSIHQATDDYISIFFAAWEDGKGTSWLSQRKVNDTVELFGPLGNGFSIDLASRKLLLIAGGMGIAPLYFLAEQALDHGHLVKLLRGVTGESKPSGRPNPPQHYPEELLPSGLEIETITSSHDGRTGMVIDLLRPEVVDWADQVFICGPNAMYQSPEIQGLLLKRKPVQISLEVRMACGLGVCYTCTVKTRNGLKQVCKDGPVFDLEEILWDESYC